jgi:spore coat polysaccharide biosynthesis predicted glycosyltransferase SpsG
LGGSDLHNVTLQVINALKIVNSPDLKVKIVAGASNPYIKALKDAMFSAPCTMSILQDVENMAELMSWADVAISAGGSTCWELSYMKLPFATIVLEDNQKDISDGVERAGIAISCGWYHKLDATSLAKILVELIHDSNCRSSMSEKAGELVDGLGIDRTLNAMVAVR